MRTVVIVGERQLVRQVLKLLRDAHYKTIQSGPIDDAIVPGTMPEGAIAAIVEAPIEGAPGHD